VSLPDFSTLGTGSDGAVSFAEIDSLTTSWVDANQLATATLEPNGELPGTTVPVCDAGRQILINGPDRILLFVVDHHAVKLDIFSVEHALTPS
jgi:hypothetical protein